ncbi:hypothetical protein [Lentzea kentuckyensis]|uniref:hypothetical protein n=1 Tax=Lentzea kentuckyensis TaxID=360086 RepID=UPI00117AE381|nr:hypothetical protein [Lentzea kentuckyensis]
MTVPPGLRQPPYEQRGNFETIEVYAPVQTVQAPEPVEQPEAREERADIAVIGPIAALVLALTISTLILEHPAARAVAAGLATVGLVVAVVLMLMGKRPQPGRHVARHAIEGETSDQTGTVRFAPGQNTADRDGTARIGGAHWKTPDQRR